MSTSPITLEEFKGALPLKLKGKVSPEVLGLINKRLTENNTCESLRSNMIGYSHVLTGGKFSMQEYVNAITYVSFKLMGVNNREAYVKTYPEKYAKFLAQGVDMHTIDRYVYAVNGSKLVNLIYEQALIPTHLINSDVFQEAINTQASIMRNDEASFKVRSDAADSLMNRLKQPEVKKIELDIGLKESDSMEELREVTRKLAEQQKSLLATGLSTLTETAESSIIVSTCEEVQ